ncbi:MAG: cytochrome c family protein [Desulfobacterales bacterium]|nr:cytochrome c family protein [Desulfobacterales bacterium]
MRPENERKLAVGLGLVLLGVATLCYTALSPAAPDEPVRLLFDGSAGDVLFTHQTHAQDYDLECASCHHNLEDGDEIYNCGECHDEGGDAEDYPTTDAMHAQCIGCHDEMGAGPAECAECHATPK